MEELRTAEKFTEPLEHMEPLPSCDTAQGEMGIKTMWGMDKSVCE